MFKLPLANLQAAPVLNTLPYKPPFRQPQPSRLFIRHSQQSRPSCSTSRPPYSHSLRYKSQQLYSPKQPCVQQLSQIRPPAHLTYQPASNTFTPAIGTM
ncbi:unnamed protein product [Ranitomeya imitator]|uniref:Uncharacterized protein n=1 Tax=Ranitomeya imitator TaxID=111125 RepID=A0ABN9KSV6_9NEOB|nr:unnamed protein product [Ranitomeya imitator]